MWHVEADLSVKAATTGKGWSQDFQVIACSDDNNAISFSDFVQLMNKKLLYRKILLYVIEILVIACNFLNFIDEDNASVYLFSCFEAFDNLLVDCLVFFNRLGITDFKEGNVHQIISHIQDNTALSSSRSTI